MVARAAFILPLSFVSNLRKKNAHEKLTLKKQVRAFSLFRGYLHTASYIRNVVAIKPKLSEPECYLVANFAINHQLQSSF